MKKLNYAIMFKIKERIDMALAIDKDGKVFEKHLTMSEETIRKVISKGNTKKQKEVLQKALKVKFNHEIAS